jgi:hypothetical protein
MLETKHWVGKTRYLIKMPGLHEWWKTSGISFNNCVLKVWMRLKPISTSMVTLDSPSIPDRIIHGTISTGRQNEKSVKY